MSDEVEARAVLKDSENIKFFRELQEYMDEDIPQHVCDKTGQAATVRMAIRMAHNHMQEHREERKEVSSRKRNIDTRRNEEADKL